MITDVQIEAAKKAYSEKNYTQMGEIFQEQIKGAMKYLTKISVEFTGSQPDTRDIFNAVIWAVESYVANGRLEEIDNEDDLNISAIEYLAGIYSCKRLSKEVLEERCNKWQDTVAIYVNEVYGADKTVHTSVPKIPTKPSFRGLLESVLQTPATVKSGNTKSLSLL